MPTYICQFGTYTPLSDTFTLVLDCNDGQNLELETDGLQLPMPDVEALTASNLRLPAERVTSLRDGPRTISLTLTLGPSSTYASMQTILQTLVSIQQQCRTALLAAASGIGASSRVALKLQPPGSTIPIQADILALAFDVPTMGDTTPWLRSLHEGITIDCLCAPYFRGSKQTLDNLVPNAGMEQAGPLQVWTELGSSASTIPGYTVVTGSPPFISSNNFDVPSGTDITFGNAWQWITSWQFAFIANTAGTFSFWVRRNAAGTQGIKITITGLTTITISYVVAGVGTVVATETVALTGGGRYWLSITALPSVSFLQSGSTFNGVATTVTAQLYASSGSSIGAAIGSLLFYNLISPYPFGVLGITAAGAQLSIGNSGTASPAAMTVSVLAADSWALNTTASDAAAAPASGGWDQVNTYALGPWASAGAATLGAPAGGIFHAQWASLLAPVPTGATQCALAIQAKSTGMSGTATLALALLAYDSTQTYLSSVTAASLNANTLSAWTQLTGIVTLPASTAYVALALIAYDSVSAASAGATLWLDMAQISTGNILLPYSENRYAQSPGQIQFSGLGGDVPAPAQLAIGTLPNGGSLAAGGQLAIYAGRRALSSFGATLTGPGMTFNADGTTAFQIADGTTWSGMQSQYKTAGGLYEVLFLTGHVAGMAGVYHLLARLKTHDAGYVTQQLIVLAYQIQSAWLGLTTKLDRLGIFQGGILTPFTGTVWQVADAGQVALPPFAQATSADPAQTSVTVGCQNTNGTTELDADWGMLLPVDADLIAATFTNNTSGVALADWIWAYFDALALHATGQTSAIWSLEATAQPNIAHAGGGPGGLSQYTPSLTSIGDTIPRVDPQLSTSTASGVNQWAILVTDTAASILPIACTLTYIPLYLKLV